MTKTLYVRIRGSVQGPFELEKLQLLVRRGQLGRLHELSRDGLNWSRAAEFPEVFEAAKAVAQAKLDESRRVDVAAPAAKAAMQQANPASEGPWYYAIGGQECGPVQYESLRELAGRGAIRPETLVWTPRLAAWMPVSGVAGLDLFSATARASDTSTAMGATVNVNDASADCEIGDLADNLTQAATMSRGWAILTVVVLFLMTALLIVRSAALIGLGIGRGEGLVAVSGLLTFGVAVVLAIAAVLLGNYCRHLGKLSRTRGAATLESALRALRWFWAYAGVMLALGLMILTILVISNTIVAFTAAGE